MVLYNPMSTLLLYTQAKPTVGSKVEVVAVEETPADIKALLKDQDRLAAILKGREEGGVFLTVEPKSQLEVKPVRNFVVSPAAE